MIYSASRRTDLVAFYPDYIADKVARSRKLEAIVLWTKDPRHLSVHPRLRMVIESVPTVVQLTITGLAGTAWEPRVPLYREFRGALQDLATRLPPGAVVWRFDPILVTEDLVQRFAETHQFLQTCLGKIDHCIVSFPDAYQKVVTRLSKEGRSLPEVSPEAERQVLQLLAEIAGPDFRFKACCEPRLLDLPNVEQAHCVDGRLFDRLYGTRFGDLPKDAGQRKDCGCVRSTDIGSYEQVCRHNCRYCYAQPEA